jgi:hypothetical protein
MPIEATTRFLANTIEGSIDRGGWQATGSFVNDQGAADYGRRVDVYFTGEGDGVWDASASLGLKASILPQLVRFDYKQSGTEVTVSTTDIFLQNAALQGIFFADPTKLTPPTAVTNPHQYDPLTLGEIVKHIIEQHTNVSSTGVIQNSDGTFSATPIGGWVDTSDIDITNSTTADVYTVRQNNSMWRTIQDVAANEFYAAKMSRWDEFSYNPNPMFDAVLPSFTIELDDTYLVGQPEVTFRNDVQIDQVLLMALTDDGDILKSEYPANVAATGRRLSITNLRCNSQSRLDTLAERKYLFETRPYDLRLTIAGPWGLEIDLLDRISLTYSGTSRNGIELSFVDEPFWTQGIRVNRAGNFGAITELDIMQENLGLGSVSVSVSA